MVNVENCCVLLTANITNHVPMIFAPMWLQKDVSSWEKFARRVTLPNMDELYSSRNWNKWRRQFGESCLQCFWGCYAIL